LFIALLSFCLWRWRGARMALTLFSIVAVILIDFSFPAGIQFQKLSLSVVVMSIVLAVCDFFCLSFAAAV
jgi:hypothetical protein